MAKEKQYRLRKDLTPLPRHMLGLPVDKRGYPVPFFVEWINGEPEFRVMDTRRLKRAVEERLCWVCGEKLGAHLAFPVGPMCCINRISGEPPCHRDCAEWSAINCPFLSRPNMERRPSENITGEDGSKVIVNPMMNLRNPEVTAVWLTKNYAPFYTDKAKKHVVFQMGEPEEILWFREGKPASLDPVAAALADGLELLREQAAKAGEGDKLLVQGLASIAGRLPKGAA